MPLSDESVALLPPLTSGQGGCLCCPSKPIQMEMDAQPHPGFGMLSLTLNGDTPEWWNEYCDVSRSVYVPGGWETLRTRDGGTVEYFSGDWWIERPSDGVTLGEIEEAVAESGLTGDWRLCIYGAMTEYTYQRHGPGNWVLVGKGMGFA
jgi:hypothetical protein